MDPPPASLAGLIATALHQAANPPPYTPPDFAASASGINRDGQNSSSSSTDASASQDPALSTLSLLSRAEQLANSLSVISDNDPLRDISTSSLRVPFLDSLKAELEIQVRTGRDHAARKQRIRNSLVASLRFLSRVVELNVMPAQTKALVLQQLASARLSSLICEGAVSILDNLTLPAGAALMPPRDLKITLFKLERAIKESLDEFRKAFAASKLSPRGMEKQPADPFFDLLLFSAEDKRGVAALTSVSQHGTSHVEEDDDDEDEDEDDDATERDASPTDGLRPKNVRQYLLLLLNYHAIKTSSTAASSAQELELLQSMPPPPDAAQAAAEEAARQNAEDAEWRLDSSLRAGKGWSGPLLDDKGKPMRPFTITASGSAAVRDRQQIKDEVFRPSHRLPTMSIDEYLEEEERRGNIITGGGAEGAAKATPREARALRAENDGTIEAQEAEEEARLEAIQWDRFTEENKKGAGNTMNRG